MTVFLTGGSGFVGRTVIDLLLKQGHAVHALVNQKPIDATGVRSFPGGLFDAAAVDAAMRDCSTAVHLVGIIKENPAKGITFDRIHFQGTVSVVEAAKRAGISRYLHMSAIGASAHSPAVYHQTKFAAEQAVRRSGLDWTIFRPSMIVGPGGDFSEMQERWARGAAPPWFFMPYFGAGILGLGRQYRVQPVQVGDVARAFAQAIDKRETIGEIFEIGGDEQLTWPQMHQRAAEQIIGRKKPVVAIPAWWALLLAKMLPSSLLPFTADQVRMSQQDNVCEMSKFEQAFGWKPAGMQSAECRMQNELHDDPQP